jgi:hypothetical protein
VRKKKKRKKGKRREKNQKKLYLLQINCDKTLGAINQLLGFVVTDRKIPKP